MTDEPQTTHDYNFNPDIPCSAAAAFDALKQAGVSDPFGPAAKEGTTGPINLEGFALGLDGPNPITQVVNSQNMTIVNAAGPTHIFSGTVTIRVIPTGLSSSRLSIVGSGSNSKGWFNNALNDVTGFAFFGVYMPSQVSQICTKTNAPPPI